VPLIFLDTPQIDVLEKTRRTDPGRYRSFCDAWKRRGYTLVFTLTQAGELIRYPDASRREGRYQVVGDLAPVRTDFAMAPGRSAGPRTLFDREILRAMSERGLVTATGTGVAQLAEWTDVLPGRLDTDAAEHLRVAMENQEYRDMENRAYNAARHAAAAEKLDAQRGKNLRVRNLPHTPVPPEKVPDCWAGFESALSLLKEQARMGNVPPVSEESLEVVRDFFGKFLSGVQEIGPRETLLEFLHVSGPTRPEQLKLTTHDLAVRWLFERLVRGVARDLIGAPESEQESLVRALDPGDCPAFWLEWRLRACVQRASGEPKPSHHHDAQRVAYLPYVDLLFTDWEMAELVRQVMRDHSTPGPIRALRAPVAIPNSLEALEEALDSLNPGTGKKAVGT
jgi:putative intracellular protease/amidase